MAVKTKDEIENMSAKERLWNNLDYSYGTQRAESDKSYNRAKSEADRRALARGMQRSSANEQVQANLSQQQVEAQNKSYEAQNAAYMSGLNALEQQEKEDDRWERQFAETLNQNRWQRSFQETAAQRAADEFNLRFNAEREDAAFSKDMQRQQFAANQDQTLWQRGITEQQLADTQANTAWQQGITERELANSEAQTAWQQGITERELANSEAQTAWQRDFQEAQFEAQREQWREQFDYEKMSADQKLAYDALVMAAERGNDVSDDLLARAGLSRADFNAIKKAAVSYTPVKKKEDEEVVPITDADFNKNLFGFTVNPTDSTGKNRLDFWHAGAGLTTKYLVEDAIANAKNRKKEEEGK